MNFLNNMKITQRLIALLSVLMIGLAAIALTFYYFESQQSKSISQQQSFSKFGADASDFKSSLLEAIRYEQLYLAENNVKHIETHKEFIGKSKTTIELMSRTSPDKSFSASLQQIEKELIQFEESVAKVFESALALGYGVDENTGSVGEMREYVHQIEEVLNKLDSSELMVLMLSMRRHEKDFQLRENNKYLGQMADTSKEFKRQVNSSSLPSETKLKLDGLLTEYLRVFTDIVSGTNTRNGHTLTSQAAVKNIQPLVESLVSVAAVKEKSVQAKSESTLVFLNWLFSGVLLLISGAMIGFMLLLAKSINTPISHFLNVINDLAAGKESRVERAQKDEIGDLGRAFDLMLNERQAVLKAREKEADELNDSIIQLMEAAADLSERDFTVNVPVSENITGTVSDALNMMASRVSNVLSNIKNIAYEVKLSAQTVQDQGLEVTNLAAEERGEVQRTIAALNVSTESMNAISALAENCKKIAEDATITTGSALEQVLETASGINDIRSTISETEKRIKRLGERSQEISSVVEIINNVATQTQVLALNASMQAAAAGEAGRGFSVVADEVQRLAKSSRESTSEIANLVNNIQLETAETMAAMNKAIELVVEGTKRAERSGEKMRETQATTNQLAEIVTKVAENAGIQAAASTQLRDESQRISLSTEKTSAQLKLQSEVTASLVQGSQDLNDSVSEFKLRA